MADTLKDITELLPRVDRSSGSPDSVWLEVGIIVGVSGVIVIGFMIWAKFFRNTGRRRSRKSLQVMGQGRSEEERSVARERSRRHRQNDRYTQRNPTLAEKGGLPPVRRDVDEPPAAPPASSLPS